MHPLPINTMDTLQSTHESNAHAYSSFATTSPYHGNGAVEVCAVVCENGALQTILFVVVLAFLALLARVDHAANLHIFSEKAIRSTIFNRNPKAM